MDLPSCWETDRDTCHVHLPRARDRVPAWCLVRVSQEQANRSQGTPPGGAKHRQPRQETGFPANRPRPWHLMLQGVVQACGPSRTIPPQ